MPYQREILALSGTSIGRFSVGTRGRFAAVCLSQFAAVGAALFKSDEKRVAENAVR